MSDQNNFNELNEFCNSLQLTLKYYNENTTSYENAPSSEMLYKKLNFLINKFINLFIVKYEVPTVDLNIITKNDKIKIGDAIIYLRGLDNMLKYTDLLIIRDQIIYELFLASCLYKLN